MLLMYINITSLSASGGEGIIPCSAELLIHLFFSVVVMFCAAGKVQSLA